HGCTWGGRASCTQRVFEKCDRREVISCLDEHVGAVGFSRYLYNCRPRFAGRFRRVPIKPQRLLPTTLCAECLGDIDSESGAKVLRERSTSEVFGERVRGAGP